MTQAELDYAKKTEKIKRGGSRFIASILAIKNQVNATKAKAVEFFGIAGTSGARDVLLSAASISYANENRLVSTLTAAESIIVFTALAALQADQTPDVATPEKLLLIAQRIAVGYQLSNISTAPHEIASGYDYQIQSDGSVTVDDI